MTNTREEVVDKLIGQARAVFERVTESYYEGDFTKYEPDGDYVCAQQQDDFTMFLSGYHQGLNYMVEKSCASVAAAGHTPQLVAALKAIYEIGDIAVASKVVAALSNLPEELKQ